MNIEKISNGRWNLGHKAWLLASSTVAAFVTTASSAQTASENRLETPNASSTATDAASSMAASAGDIVVTARRRAEDLSKVPRSEEHTSELQSLMLISYAVFCLKKKKRHI